MLIKKLLYRSNNMGCKELDFILGGFAKENLSQMLECELLKYQEILNYDSNDLLHYLTGNEVLENAMMEKIRLYARCLTR